MGGFLPILFRNGCMVSGLLQKRIEFFFASIFSTVELGNISVGMLNNKKLK